MGAETAALTLGAGPELGGEETETPSSLLTCRKSLGDGGSYPMPGKPGTEPGKPITGGVESSALCASRCKPLVTLESSSEEL